MIPPFDEVTGYLPRGAHPATWAELETALGFGIRRRRLLGGLLAVCRMFRDAGAGVIYVDGSFATATLRPKDFDCCYPAQGVDSSKLDPIVLFDGPAFSPQAMKDKYLGEMWPAEIPAPKAAFEGTILDLFMRDKGYHYKGLLALDLSTLP